MNPTSKPLHVLLVTPAFPPFPGGGERYAHALALNLARRGQRVTVVTSTAQAEQDFWRGRPRSGSAAAAPGELCVIRCPLRPFPGGRHGLLAWRKAMTLLSLLPGDQTAVLLRMARLIPPIQGLSEALDAHPTAVDVVHGFNISWEHALATGWEFARRRALPYAATPFTHFGVMGADRVARNSTMDHQRRILRTTGRVFALTAVEKAGLTAFGVDPRRITVCGGGADPPPATIDQSLPAQKYGLAQPYVLFVGRAGYEKGAIHAAQAIIALRQAGHEALLALAGQSTPEFARFYARLPRDLQEGIRPLGVVSEPDKHALLAGAQMLVLPSRTDSFGIVLLEAWAHGKAVIGARAGGIPGVIDADENGLLVDFGDVAALTAAIRQLLTDPNARQKLGRSGQAKVTRVYNWSGVTDLVLAGYAALLDEADRKQRLSITN
jgi:glycogen synthase